MILTTLGVTPHVHVLVIEDNPIRHDWFRSKLPHVDIATSAQEAIDLLDASNMNRGLVNNYDVIFFDHDTIPQFVSLEDSEFHSKTFWRAAEHLYNMFDDLDVEPIVVIHSGNPTGAERIKKLLEPKFKSGGLYVWPFGTFEIEVGL